MTKQEIKDTLKRLLKLAVAEIKLIDGTVVTTNEIDLAVGVEIFTINEDGTNSPMNDGDYEFENGDKFSVSQGMISVLGEPVIEEVIPAEEVVLEIAQDAPIEEVIPEVNTEIEDLKKTIEDLQKQIDEINAAMGITMSAVENQAVKLSKINPAQIVITNKTVKQISDNQNDLKELIRKQLKK